MWVFGFGEVPESELEGWEEGCGLCVEGSEEVFEEFVVVVGG